MTAWLPEESKRDLLDRLFPQLIKTDKGQRAFITMAKYLMEQRSFPDLENWEDSNEKIKNAHDAVSRLKIYHQKQEEDIESEEAKKAARALFRKRQEDISRSQQSIQKLNSDLNELGKNLGKQKAGYEFQDWFYSLLDFSEITNRKPYNHGGRQIDGSLTLSETTYLVELKFTTDQATATDIDTFFKKVITKADNTMGVMVSISGYSSVAIQEASGDRTPILLLDHSHIYLVLSGILGMRDVVERVRRHASQTGEAYLAASDFTA
ncbi:MAG: restriction endonuclease [Thermoleophilia bacterium]